MKRTLMTAAACAALALAGCGDSKKEDADDAGGPVSPSTPGPADPSTGNGAQGNNKILISADETGELRFDQESLKAKAGKVTIEMDNPSSVPHAVGVRDNGVEEVGETVGMGGKSTVSVDVKAGEYEFYCPVNGHDQAGMKGTLTVE